MKRSGIIFSFVALAMMACLQTGVGGHDCELSGRHYRGHLAPQLAEQHHGCCPDQAPGGARSSSPCSCWSYPQACPCVTKWSWLSLARSQTQVPHPNPLVITPAFSPVRANLLPGKPARDFPDLINLHQSIPTTILLL